MLVISVDVKRLLSLKNNELVKYFSYRLLGDSK